jgi:hypothetical protein
MSNHTGGSSSTPLDFDGVNRAALAQMRSFLERLIPGGRVESGEYVVRNPTRNDQHPGSFKINLRTGLWCDFAGADKDKGNDPISLAAYVLGMRNGQAAREVANMVGFHIDDDGPSGNSGAEKWRTEGEWIYQDANEEPYLRVVRMRTPEGKKVYPQYHRENGQWVKGKPDGPKVPYRLAELLDSDRTEPVWIFEGEKLVEIARKLGMVATCNSEGAKKWTADLNEWFRDRIAYAVPDEDKIGHDHAHDVARNLHGIAREVKIVRLPTSPDGSTVYIQANGARRIEMPSVRPDQGDDLEEFADKGGTADDMRILGEAAPVWTPPPKDDKPKNTNPKKRATGKEIQTMKFNPVKFLVPGLIPSEGVTLIAAKPKVGKSWMVLDLAIAATTDRFTLGDLKPTQGDVLYLALEDGFRRIQLRMSKLLPTFAEKWPETLTVALEWRRVDDGGLDDIREWASQVKAAGRKPAFVAIDVLKMIRPSPKKTQTLYDCDYEAIAGLRNLSIELGIPIIVVHHLRKASADDLIDMVSSTTGLTGAVDAIIIINRETAGTVFDVRGRDIESETFAVEFRKDTCRWTILGSAETVHRSGERARILEIFAEATEPLSPKAVTELVNCDSPGKRLSHDAVRQMLIRMHKTGDLTRPETL